MSSSGKERENKANEPQRLQPGDFYINENGLMVFTEKYHLRRGYCCGSKCKHCPFNWQNVK